MMFLIMNSSGRVQGWDKLGLCNNKRWLPLKGYAVYYVDLGVILDADV